MNFFFQSQLKKLNFYSLLGKASELFEGFIQEFLISESFQTKKEKNYGREHTGEKSRQKHSQREILDIENLWNYYFVVPVPFLDF